MVEAGSQGEKKKAPSKSSFTGAPENSAITNTIACYFIFSNVRGPEGKRGCGNTIFFFFLFHLANGTPSSFHA